MKDTKLAMFPLSPLKTVHMPIKVTKGDYCLLAGAHGAVRCPNLSFIAASHPICKVGFKVEGNTAKVIKNDECRGLEDVGN